jgi:excisionase family DNA binding protein
MTGSIPYGRGARMLTLSELCVWLNITERHADKLVERNAIPYRKVGRLLRFAEQDVEEWSRPTRPRPGAHEEMDRPVVSAVGRLSPASLFLPKSLIEQEDWHGRKRAS